MFILSFRSLSSKEEDSTDSLLSHNEMVWDDDLIISTLREADDGSKPYFLFAMFADEVTKYTYIHAPSVHYTEHIERLPLVSYHRMCIARFLFCVSFTLSFFFFCSKIRIPPNESPMKRRYSVYLLFINTTIPSMVMT